MFLNFFFFLFFFIIAWLCSINKIKFVDLDIPVAKIDSFSLRKHLIEFFQYYIDFNYEEDVMCIYRGYVVSYANLHHEMPIRYTKKRNNHFYINFLTFCSIWRFKDQRKEKDQFISAAVKAQAPFQLNNNTTKKVKLHSLELFREYAKMALSILKNRQ